MPSRYARRQARARGAECEHDGVMAGLLIVLAVVGIVLILLGVFVEVVKFLLWIGIVLLLIALIWWLMRVVRRNA